MALPLSIFCFHTRKIMATHGLSRFYDQLWNVTIATDNDADGNRILSEEMRINLTGGGDYAALYKSNANTLTRSSFSLSLYPTRAVKYQEATMEKFHNCSNLIFYQTRESESVNNASPYRFAPVNNKTVVEGLPKSSLGFGLPPDEWLKQFADSKYCLNVRGDTPHSHSLLRAVKLGCIPVVVAEGYALFAPTLKSSVDMHDYAIFIKEKRFLSDPLGELQRLQYLPEDVVRRKIKALAFAQRVLFHDHPESLFIPAFLKEAAKAYAEHVPGPKPLPTW
jgi:hypothetical protein